MRICFLRWGRVFTVLQNNTKYNICPTAHTLYNNLCLKTDALFNDKCTQLTVQLIITVVAWGKKEKTLKKTKQWNVIYSVSYFYLHQRCRRRSRHRYHSWSSSLNWIPKSILFLFHVGILYWLIWTKFHFYLCTTCKIITRFLCNYSAQTFKMVVYQNKIIYSPSIY